MTKRSSIFDRWHTEDILIIVFYSILVFVFNFLLTAVGWWFISVLLGFEFSWNWAAAFWICTIFFGGSNGLNSLLVNRKE